MIGLRLEWVWLRRFLFYFIGPINFGVIVLYVADGRWWHAALVLIWSFLIFANFHEYTGWRKRVNAFTVREKLDRDRFAIDALKLKATAAHAFAKQYSALAKTEPDVLTALRIMFEDVAATWIPTDAPAEYHELKRRAQLIADGDSPPVIH